MIIFYIIALLLVGMGLLVVHYPMLISGYNTLPREKREKVDIRPVSLAMRKGFVTTGCLMIVGGLLSDGFGCKDWTPGVVSVILLIGIFVTLYLAWKADKNTMFPLHAKGTLSSQFKISMWILATVMIIAGGGIWYGSIPAKIEVADNVLTISGSYGIDLPLKDITQVKRVAALPPVMHKSNGIGMGKILRGHFRLKDIGPCRLFLHAGHGPYLIVYSKKYTPVIINRSNTNEINHIYEQLTARTE